MKEPPKTTPEPPMHKYVVNEPLEHAIANVLVGARAMKAHTVTVNIERFRDGAGTVATEIHYNAPDLQPNNGKSNPEEELRRRAEEGPLGGKTQ